MVYGVKRLQRSFGHAIDGLLHTLKYEKNMQIHMAAMVIVLFLSYLFEVKGTEIVIIIFAIMLVIVCELINTALEMTLDLFVKGYNPIAKTAKDIAAAAVFISAIGSVIIGIIIFCPKIKEIMN